MISPYSFRLSFVSGDTELPVPPAAEILAMVRARPPWDEASVAPDQGQFPRLHVSRCDGHGFILHCFEDGEFCGDFLVTGLAFSTPTIEINLGGQALERWPPELFVLEQIAEGALSFFLRFGKRDPMRQWTKGDAFPRETVWEDREQGEAWKRAQRGV